MQFFGKNEFKHRINLLGIIVIYRYLPKYNIIQYLTVTYFTPYFYLLAEKYNYQHFLYK